MDAKKIYSWIEMWKSRGYKHDLPDEAPEIFEQENMAPSFRRVCLAIMKNDCQLQTLGFSREPCSIYKVIKRDELISNGKIKTREKQMRLFDERI